MKGFLPISVKNAAVWKVCAYRREDRTCDQCARVVNTTYGLGYRGCYELALETITQSLDALQLEYSVDAFQGTIEEL